MNQIGGLDTTIKVKIGQISSLLFDHLRNQYYNLFEFF